MARRSVRLLALLLAVAFAPAGDARGISFGPFGPRGEGGAANGQHLAVGPGGEVFEIDAFLAIDGRDLNGDGVGTAAQLSRDALPPGLSLGFEAVLSPDATDLTLSYTLTNDTGGALEGVTFLSFVDAEIDAGINTYFNEYAQTAGSLAAGQGFEVDEPGFTFGDIFGNLLLSRLDGSNAVPAGAPEDVAVALSFSLGTLGPGATRIVDIQLSEDGDAIGSFAIHHLDMDPASGTSITYSGAVVPEPSSAWLALAGMTALAAAGGRGGSRGRR